MIDDDMIIWSSLSSAYSCDAMIKIKMMMMIPRYDMIRYTIVTKAKGLGRNANTKDVGKTTYSIGRSSEDTGDRICKDTLWHCTHFPHTLPATVIFFKNPANAIPIRLINGKSKTNIHQNSEKKNRETNMWLNKEKKSFVHVSPSLPAFFLRVWFVFVFLFPLDMYDSGRAMVRY